MDPFAGISWLSRALRPDRGSARDLPKPPAPENDSFDRVMARAGGDWPVHNAGAAPPEARPHATPGATTQNSRTPAPATTTGSVRAAAAFAHPAQRGNGSSKPVPSKQGQSPASDPGARTESQKAPDDVPSPSATTNDSDGQTVDPDGRSNDKDDGQNPSGNDCGDDATGNSPNLVLVNIQLPSVTPQTAAGSLNHVRITVGSAAIVGRAISERAHPGVADNSTENPGTNAAKTDKARENSDPNGVHSATSHPAADADELADSGSAAETEQAPLESASDSVSASTTSPAEGSTASAAAAQGTASDPAKTSAAMAKPGSTVSPAGTGPPAGTSAAQYDLAMKKAEKMAKTAGSAEQELPGLTVLAAQAQSALSKDLSGVVSSPAVHEAAAAGAVSAPQAVTEQHAPGATAVDSSQLSDARLRTAERTHDLVALHAMRLRDSSMDSLRIVVKPAAGVQLSLEFTSRGGSIEARATLNRGDYQFFNQCWPDLQQRLESRGVQLAPLARGENVAGDTGGFKQPRKQAEEKDPAAAGAFAEFALASAMTESPATRAVRAAAHRGWETWA